MNPGRIRSLLLAVLGATSAGQATPEPEPEFRGYSIEHGRPYIALALPEPDSSLAIVWFELGARNRDCELLRFDLAAQAVEIAFRGQRRVMSLRKPVITIAPAPAAVPVSVRSDDADVAVATELLTTRHPGLEASPALARDLARLAADTALPADSADPDLLSLVGSASDAELNGLEDTARGFLTRRYERRLSAALAASAARM